MKKIILTLAAVLMATSVYAGSGSYLPASVYSVGSISKSPFKTSPKVTLNYVYTDGATVAAASTDWAAVSYHASAISNKKGNAFWTSKSDPGMWYYKNEAAGFAVADIGISAVTTPTEATGTAAGWRPEGK